MKKIEGVFTALVTPFDESGALNEEVLRSIIRFQIAAGVQGIVVLGSTGETPTLTPSEKEKIISIAREETLYKIYLMVGTGTYSTADTIENTILAQSLGADSALVVAPYYNRPTQEGLFQHYKALCQAVQIPIMVYNVPSRSGVNIQIDTLQRIAEMPEICGIKEASGNMQQISEVIEKVGRISPHFSVLSGDDALTFPTVALGGQGIISVLSNLIPLQICALTEAGLKEEYIKARNLHHDLMPLFRAAFIETNPIPIKVALNMMGIKAGGCRLPLYSLSLEHEKDLKTILKNSPFNFFLNQNTNLLN